MTRTIQVTETVRVRTQSQRRFVAIACSATDSRAHIIKRSDSIDTMRRTCWNYGWQAGGWHVRVFDTATGERVNV